MENFRANHTGFIFALSSMVFVSIPIYPAIVSLVLVIIFSSVFCYALDIKQKIKYALTKQKKPVLLDQTRHVLTYFLFMSIVLIGLTMIRQDSMYLLGILMIMTILAMHDGEYLSIKTGAGMIASLALINYVGTIGLIIGICLCVLIIFISEYPYRHVWLGYSYA